jgi:acetyl-CoA carboxylase biotin carboxyl carrier protein
VINHQPVIYNGVGPAAGVAATRHAPSPGGAEDDGPGESGATAAPAAPAADGLLVVESPMVGTFYTSPNPDSPAFVTVGSSIAPDTTVCLIEAMKVFNEIKAEMSGTIERILVESGKPVEYGQKLFLVRPS